jgi:hypothetical protein
VLRAAFHHLRHLGGVACLLGTWRCVRCNDCR